MADHPSTPREPSSEVREAARVSALAYSVRLHGAVRALVPRDTHRVLLFGRGPLPNELPPSVLHVPMDMLMLHAYVEEVHRRKVLLQELPWAALRVPEHAVFGARFLVVEPCIQQKECLGGWVFQFMLVPCPPVAGRETPPILLKCEGVQWAELGGVAHLLGRSAAAAVAVRPSLGNPLRQGWGDWVQATTEFMVQADPAYFFLQ